MITSRFCLACDDKSQKRDIGITFSTATAATSSTIIRHFDIVLYISKSIQAIHFKLEKVIQLLQKECIEARMVTQLPVFVELSALVDLDKIAIRRDIYSANSC